MLKLSARTGSSPALMAPVAETRQHGKMVVTLVLLLLALGLVLVRDRQFWFGEEGTPVAAQTAPATAPQATARAHRAVPAKPSKQVAAKPAKTTLVTTAVAADRSPLPPLQIQVVSSDTRRTAPAPAIKVQTSAAPAQPPAKVTAASERVRIPDQSYAQRQPLDAAYPLLAEQSRIEGSVVLEVLIAADGVIQNMRVVSGPPILAAAAREAVRNWRFKPYIQNGQAVETSATITVNLVIKVLDNQIAHNGQPSAPW